MRILTAELARLERAAGVYGVGHRSAALATVLDEIPNLRKISKETRDHFLAQFKEPRHKIAAIDFLVAVSAYIFRRLERAL